MERFGTPPLPPPKADRFPFWKEEGVKTIRYLTPVKAIRKYCLECSGQSTKEVRECSIKDCPLYRYRLGKNPNRTPHGI